jgi:hypothetical protein
MQAFSRLLLVLLSAAVMLTGCVSTSIQLDWKDPGFNGKFRKVLVICVAREMIVRNTLEADLAAQFTARGVAAVPSNTLIESLQYVDREQIRRKVREIDADGVFLVRPVGQDIENIWDMQTFEVPTVMTLEVYRVQSSLFETAQGKVVWQAVSDTIVGGAWMDTLQKFAKAMGAKLIERGLI